MEGGNPLYNTMKEYICLRHCQMNIEGQITLCEAGQVYSLSPKQTKDHSCFREIGAEAIDYVNASESELLSSTVVFEYANEAMKTSFNKSLNKNKDLVSQIMDIRQRNDEKTKDQQILAKAKAQAAEDKRKEKAVKTHSEIAKKKNSGNLAKFTKKSKAKETKKKAKIKADAKVQAEAEKEE